MSEPVRLLSLCGMLGYGYPIANLERGLCPRPDAIAVDSGSTDPGPYYLGAGTGFVKPAQLRRDLAPALTASVDAGIPLLVGSANGAGAAPHLETFLDIVRDLAREAGLSFRMASIGAEIDRETVRQALREGRVRACGGAPGLDEDALDATGALVAQMGTEPFLEALEGGAQVIVAGRACDTAVFAAPAIRHGVDAGLAFHAAKIAECGTLCATPGGANDCLRITFEDDAFLVEPVDPEKACTPETVAAHSLYEQPDPDRFVEPEGTIELGDCTFEAVGARAVRVRGSRLVKAQRPTLKLEGARRVGFRAITIAGVVDPVAIREIDTIEREVRAHVTEKAEGLVPGDAYTLRFLRYGLDGVTGRAPAGARPHEIGLLIEAIAPEQAQADALVSLARSTALHQPFPGRKTTAGNFAFPFSPSDFAGGEVYAFSVYHLMEVKDAGAFFPVRYEEVG